ncbi:hypothetical protein VVD49_13425 [Uliginosibacterium sp. H3]|uniref:Uncharacterized protein n=1 Tax=Uliginosibacterium silvisoli TaxID=3114758 RepID=A0ABU6K553_9RHOO|nr:hypothetical protein [Uliginosibacterium sp. H3]
MEWTPIVVAVITGIAGTFLTQYLISRRDSRTTQRQERLAAVKLIDRLRAYAKRCADELVANSLFYDSTGSCGGRCTHVPTLDDLNEQDCQYLAPKHYDAFLALRHEARIRQDDARMEWELSAAHEDDLAVVVFRNTNEIALEAIRLANRLRDELGLERDLHSEGLERGLVTTQQDYRRQQIQNRWSWRKKVRANRLLKEMMTSV